MMTAFWIIGIAAVAFLLLLIYALCRVSADADVSAGYMEEYGRDFDDIEDEEEV